MNEVSSHLFRQPHVGEVLGDVVARAHLPPADDGAVGDDAIPPMGDKHVRLLVEGSLFELPHQSPLLGHVGGAIHLVSNIVEHAVFVVRKVEIGAIVRDELRDVEDRIYHRAGVPVDAHLKIGTSASERLEKRLGRLHPHLGVEANGAPLVDEPVANDLVGLVYRAHMESE